MSQAGQKIRLVGSSCEDAIAQLCVIFFPCCQPCQLRLTTNEKGGTKAGLAEKNEVDQIQTTCQWPYSKRVMCHHFPSKQIYGCLRPTDIWDRELLSLHSRGDSSIMIILLITSID